MSEKFEWTNLRNQYIAAVAGESYIVSFAANVNHF